MIWQIWFQNLQNIGKIVPQKRKEAQNVVFNLKGRIPLLFYCVKHIHRQFKTYLKLRNIHFKQIAKTIPTFGKNLAVIFFKKAGPDRQSESDQVGPSRIRSDL
jgi:hypothetical protein